MAAPFIDLIPKTVAEGLYIDIKTRSVCDRRKVDARTYAENWSTDIWVAGFAIGRGEVKLWHPGDPVPEELTRAIANGLFIIPHDARFVRALFINIMGPRHGWPIPPLDQWVCMAAMAVAMDLPSGLDDAAKAMGIAERKDNEARSLIRRMTRPRSRTPQLCAVCAKMTCDHDKLFKTSLVWWDADEDRAHLDRYCVQDVRTARALFPLLRPLSQSAREAWLRDQINYERDMGFDWSSSEPIASIAGGPAAANASARPQGAPEIVPKLIGDHVRVIHLLAKPLTGQGKVIATGFGEDPEQIDEKTKKLGRSVRPRVIHAEIGDVKATLEGVSQFIKRPHYNLYMPLAIFRPDLASWAKGFERDVVACLGIVADFDDEDASRWAKRLPIPPNYVLETSAGRFQAFYLFDKPEPLDVVKPVAKHLKAYAGCDHGTSDISHVWRVPGALNWPNSKKVAAGRPRDPQLVRVAMYSDSRTSLQALSDALPQDGATPAGKELPTRRKPASARRAGTEDPAAPQGKAHSPHRAAIDGAPENGEALQRLLTLPPELQEQIKQPAVGDRSKAIFKVIAELIKQGLDDKAIEILIYAHPSGIGEKYAGRDDLDKEIARVRAKTATRPLVRVRGGALPSVIDQAERHLIEADLGLFQRGSFVMRLVREEIPVTHGRKIIGTRLAQVRLHHMRERFSRTVDFQKYDKRSSAWESINCPKEVAEAYLDREGEWQLPILTRVVNAPTLRPDGSVLERPGYDAATGLLFEPQDIAFPSVPTTPDLIDHVIPAVNLLAGLLRDFPFVDEASRAVALSAILTSLIRPSLRSAPLHAFTAPTAGSGKSLLVDIASMISAGHETPVMAQGRTAEEFEKRLNAAFIAGDATIAIDNCEQALGGEFLCQVLTQVSVTIRLLGQTKNNVVPTNACLFATGNNLRIIGDLTRRTIVCSLDPQCERPELRNFPADPLELIRQNRALYVAAGFQRRRENASTGRSKTASRMDAKCPHGRAFAARQTG